MGLIYSIDFTVAISKILYFCRLEMCHSLLAISKKVHVTVEFKKIQFDNALFR